MPKFPSHVEALLGALAVAWAVYGFSIRAAVMAAGLWLLTASGKQ